VSRGKVEMILGTGPGVSSISRYAFGGVCVRYSFQVICVIPVLLSRELIMGKLMESKIMSLKSRKKTGLKVLGFEVGFIALRSTTKCRNTYLPSKVISNEPRATDRPKDVPRDKNLYLACWARKLVNKAHFVVIRNLFR
jgi:hypothetical protein